MKSFSLKTAFIHTNKTTVIKTVSLSFFSLSLEMSTQSAGNHFSPIFTAEREFSKLGYPVML